MDKVIIPLNGWAAGERLFRFRAGLEFFQAFDNSEILDACVDVEVKVVKEGTRKVEADLHLSGTITVPCDRCLEPLEVPVEAHPEEVFAPENPADDWDLSQAVYDYASLSLPLQRVHPEGECNQDTVRFLGHEERTDEEAGASANSPFSALKGLFEESNN